MLAAIVAAFEEQTPDVVRPGFWPDGRGEFWSRCPYHDDQGIGSFSFSERGYCCFACGARGALTRLAATLRLAPDLSPVPREPSLPPTPAAPAWTHLDYTREFGFLPQVAKDYYHRRGFTDASLRTHRLGFGVVPASRCHHPRLVLPVFDNSALVALKGRRLDCACSEKWTQAKGSRPALFGRARLPYALGLPLIITEAPYSAILAMQDDPGLVAVAPSSGCTVWKDEWTDAIVAAKPRNIYLWYDNDPAGWTEGDKVAARFAANGVPARIVDWDRSWPDNADLADYRKANDLRLGLLGARVWRTQPLPARATSGLLPGWRIKSALAAKS